MQKYEKMTKSSLYETLPDDDKTALQNRISVTSARLLEKQRELNRIAGQLIPEDFWPHAQRIQQQSDPGYQKMELKNCIYEVGKFDYTSLGISLYIFDNVVSNIVNPISNVGNITFFNVIN